MGAATAQKIALNMMSTLTAIHLGHVHDGYMVNLLADNMKLKRRAARIVAAIAGAERAEARAALEASGGSVKPAVLLAAGARDRDRRRRACSTERRPACAPALERASGAAPTNREPERSTSNREN